MPGEARSGRDPLLGAGPPRTSAPAPATLPAICTQQDLVSTAEGPVLIRGVSTSHVPGRGGPTRTKGGPRESVRGQHGLPLPRTEAGPTRRGRGHGTESACRTQSAPGRDPRQPSAPDSPCPHRAGRPSPGRGSRRRGGRVPSLPGRSPRDPGVRPGHALPEPPPHPRPDPGPRRHLAAPLRPSAVSRGPQGGGRGQAAAPALRSVREGRSRGLPLRPARHRLRGLQDGRQGGPESLQPFPLPARAPSGWRGGALGGKDVSADTRLVAQAQLRPPTPGPGSFAPEIITARGRVLGPAPSRPTSQRRRTLTVAKGNR